MRRMRFDSVAVVFVVRGRFESVFFSPSSFVPFFLFGFHFIGAGCGNSATAAVTTAAVAASARCDFVSNKKPIQCM